MNLALKWHLSLLSASGCPTAAYLQPLTRSFDLRSFHPCCCSPEAAGGWAASTYKHLLRLAIQPDIDS